MKVLQINSACSTGSTGKIVVAISKLLNKENVENVIYYSGNHKVTYENGKLINSKFDIRVHQFLSRIFGDQGWHSVFSTILLTKEIKRQNPDIVHLHNLHGYYLNMSILFKCLAKMNVPVIWTLHDCWAFTGHCTHYTAVSCNKWKHNCGHCPRKKQYPYSWFFDRSADNLEKKKKLYSCIKKLEITTVSNWLAGEAEQSIFKGRNITVIPNGIDLTVFRPGKKLEELNGACIKNKKVVLGVANDWGSGKGYDDFIQLSYLLDDSFQIIMVGLKKEVINNLPDNIIGITRTDNVQKLVDLYTTATVFFNPSIEESFGLTTIEAMACGTPSVVYNSTASPELVPAECGAVVEVRNISAAAKAITAISKDKNAYTSKCIEHVKKYRQETIYEAYYKLYSQTIN